MPKAHFTFEGNITHEVHITFRLWITRISAAAKMNGMNYSTFMNGLKKADIQLNRKMLAEIAVSDAAAFTALVEKAKAAL